jgi:hypothetical protein
MNWGAAISAVLGALIGGVFLIVGQRYAADLNYNKSCRVVLIEMIGNLETIINQIKSLQINTDKSVCVIIHFDVKIDSYLKYEEDIVGTNLADFIKIRAAVSRIQSAKSMAMMSLPGTNMGNPHECRKSLTDLFDHLINATQVLSGRLKQNERGVIKVDKSIEDAKQHLETLRKSTQPFILYPPIWEWPVIQDRQRTIGDF